jgi:hypothetical protein
MKRNFLALLVALVAAVGLTAQSTPARPASPAQGANKAAEAEPVIEGMVLDRPDGSFLGLTLQEGKYKLAFYDRDKMPTRVNVLRGVARWPNLHGPGQNRTVLNPAGDGTYLLGIQFVRAPHSFRLFITLIAAEGVEATESYSVDFRG